MVTKYSAAPTTISQTVPLAKAPAKGKSIVCLGTSVPNVVALCKSVGVAAKAVGWGYSSVDFDPSNPATLQSALATALTRHPTVVASEGGAPPSTFGTSTISAYAKAGVPILVASTAPVTLSKTIIGVPNSVETGSTGGRVLADWFATDSHGTGKALFVGVPAYPILQAGLEGFQSELKANCSGCSVKTLNITLPELGAGQLSSTVVATLKANPSIKYVIFCLGNFADGITPALKAAGLGSIKVAGQDADAESVVGLKNKTQSAWIGGPSNYMIGFASMDIALRYAEGSSLTSNDASLPIQLLTQSNVAASTSDDGTTPWNHPADALGEFEKLWHVPATSCTLGC
jgi:ribose transport system substrate-binding protein